MNISNTLLKTLEITMDTIFKASGTDIRLHGLETCLTSRCSMS